MRRFQVIGLVLVMVAAASSAEGKDRVVVGLEPIVTIGVSENTTAAALGGMISASYMFHERIGAYGAVTASFMQQGSGDDTVRSTSLSVDIGSVLIPFAGVTWFSVRPSFLNGLQNSSGVWTYAPGAAADFVVSPVLTQRLRLTARAGAGFRFSAAPRLLPRFGLGLSMAF